MHQNTWANNALAVAFLACLALGAQETPLKPSGTNRVGMEMVLVAPPSGAVPAAPFYISRNAVTMEHWKGVMPEYTGMMGGESPKMVGQSAAERFCKRLSVMDTREYRLPTGAELEIAVGSAPQGGELREGAHERGKHPFRVVCPVPQCPDTGAYAHVFFDEGVRLEGWPKDIKYPKMGSWVHQDGNVVLRAVIGAEGRAVSVNVVEGPPGFADTAVGFVETCRFAPARVDGAPVPAGVVVNIPMRLRHYVRGFPPIYEIGRYRLDYAMGGGASRSIWYQQ